MRIKCILALLLLSCNLFSYTYITPLFNTEVTRGVQNNGGLFVDQAIIGGYNPFTFGLNTKLYYRIVLFDPKMPSVISNTNSSTNVIDTNALAYPTTNVADTSLSNNIQIAPSGDIITINTNTSDIASNMSVSNVEATTNMAIRFKQYALTNTRLDFGIENNFSPANDLLGVFIYFAPVSFFSVGVSAYSTFWYTGLKSGYLGFDSLDNIKYSPTDIKDSKDRTNSVGFLVRLTPSIHFKVGSFIFQNTTTITYEFADGKSYYFNNRIFLPHRKHGFDINNDTYLLGNTYPIFVGIYYGFTYIKDYSNMEHRFGVAAMTHYKFLQDRLLLDIGASSGINLTLKNYEGSTFIEARVAINYRIF